LAAMAPLASSMGDYAKARAGLKGGQGCAAHKIGCAIDPIGEVKVQLDIIPPQGVIGGLGATRSS
jgi:hypothetical protein